MKHKIIFKTIVGSRAYGTNIETSDTDFKGIYVQSNDDILCFRYNQQTDVNKDECYYEVRRFLQLAQSANPTILEMLFMSGESVIKTSPEFELIKKYRKEFLTKKCCMSFGGYAIAQIKKAKGLNKKMNWEKDRVKRKSPLDFVYVCIGHKTMPIAKWLKQTNRTQDKCGLVSLNNFRDGYALFYANDDSVELLKYKGIISPNSNELKLSSIPKGEVAIATVIFNKDGYSSHCKDYNEYKTWLENRNTQRYVDLKGYNQKIDGKNLLHCRRLLDMAIEIAKEKTLTVLRPNVDYLLKIRRGEIGLDEIIEKAERDIEGLDELYDNSDLPSSVDMEFVNELLLKIRHMQN